MCEQCNAASIGWPLFEDRYLLVRARRDGDEMKKGEYGLVWINGPDVIWDCDMSPKEDGGFRRSLYQFERQFVMRPSRGFQLWNYAEKNGFKADDNDLEEWLFERMIKLVKENPNGMPGFDTNPQYGDDYEHFDYEVKRELPPEWQ